MAERLLSSLFKDLPIPWHCDVDLVDIPVHALQFDSRKVNPGDIFVALTGGSVDGHDFIDSAIGNGAIAVVGTRDLEINSVPYIRVQDTRESLAWLAAASMTTRDAN